MGRSKATRGDQNCQGMGRSGVYEQNTPVRMALARCRANEVCCSRIFARVALIRLPTAFRSRSMGSAALRGRPCSP